MGDHFDQLELNCYQSRSEPYVYAPVRFLNLMDSIAGTLELWLPLNF